MSDPNTVSVSLMGKEYMIACPPGAEAQLQEAADFLNSKMKEIRGSGKIIGLERIAVLAALNISHEYLQHNQQQNKQAELEQRQVDMEVQLQRLNQRLDSTLQKRSPRSDG
ncbi:MAG: cell division protein ZapA [Marinobacterium sp.]|nr:cell division protein ZapA [Marinobacterium sp.]